jgi:uncharacterized protein (DUF488 family)
VSDIWTVGHSTHDADAFLSLLHAHGIEDLADVRTVPRSRRVPQFNGDTLPGWLERAGIAYQYLPALGGRRSPRPDSTTNAGWQHPSFRGYADHMQTPEFAAGLAELETIARERRAAYMCAEGLWWRCHRRMISDALAARGWRVHHIMPDGGVREHDMTAFAVVEGGTVTYPAPQGSLEV